MNLTVTTKLPGGTLRGTARIAGATTVRSVRVVGGTGNFANARGTLTVRDQNGSAQGVLNIYRLRLP